MIGMSTINPETTDNEMKTNMRNDDGTIDATQFTMQDVAHLIEVFAPMITVYMGTRREVMRHIAEQDESFAHLNYMTCSPLHGGIPVVLDGPEIQLNLECAQLDE